MKNKILITIIFLSVSAVSLFSHGSEHHVKKKELSSKQLKVKTSTKEDIVLKSKYKKINEKYIKNIKPIFEAKCFNCHSNITKYSSYYKIPGIKNVIDEDIKEARKHIDFSKDFPFISHSTPLNDLKSLNKIGREGGMPPLKYLVIHWDSKLLQKEKDAIIQWTQNAMELLAKD